MDEGAVSGDNLGVVVDVEGVIVAVVGGVQYVVVIASVAFADDDSEALVDQLV